MTINESKGETRLSARPNVLLIMCDQLRFDVLGAYGNRTVKTPNIDRLARTGLTFDNAYSQTPVCCPARYGLLSGLHPFQLGMTENGAPQGRIEHPLPRMLKSRGYFTAAIGKMHFIPVREHYGFDRMLLSEEIAGHIQDDDYLLFLRDRGYGHVVEPHGQRSERYYVPQVSELPEELHATAWTADRTIDQIRRNANRPFFIFSSFIKPHPPFDPCVPYDTMYAPEGVDDPVRQPHEKTSFDWALQTQNDYKVNGIENMTDPEIRRMRAYYYGCVTQIDKQVGKILDALEELDIRKDTLILFTSDHGELLGDHYAFGKRTYYESSARIPLLLSWPGTLPQGERRDPLVCLQDIYATCIDAGGGEVPRTSSGKSLLPNARSSACQVRDELVGEYGRGQAAKAMLRWGSFKYIYHANGGNEQLFDLAADPKEWNNIAADHPAQCKRCRESLIAYYRGYGYTGLLDGDQLLSFPEMSPPRTGFLNQYPRWPETVLPIRIRGDNR